MCGIGGIIRAQCGSDELRSSLDRMLTSLRLRGPDDRGEWHDYERGIGFCHTRLSILDLSPLGHQPMLSASGRYVITFNGEVYNFADLSSELVGRGHRFRGGSDTEVMLAAIEEWGIERAVARFNGMFAFAIWDRQEQRLSLVRDRLGVKPLYYGWIDGAFRFASELKAIEPSGSRGASVERGSLALLMCHNYIPAPHSIYKGIYKLPQASILHLDLRQAYVRPVGFAPTANGGAISPRLYWDAVKVVRDGLAHPFEGSEHDAIEEVERVMRDSIRLRMIADVPLGAFLSGGIDSSAVVALMQAQSSKPVRTFTIGFDEGAYNEAQHAKRVAAHLGTEHTELYLSPRGALDIIPLLPQLYDEPFSDCSQI
ncbi:MAG: asparagine synthase (glutamine-hydrolyzing), partial [Deltaproteobacteria bacterium]|nr:asparagine synthase (glutamine-hydrolyzing) [Deltaproteobacteria bacterium]